MLARGADLTGMTFGRLTVTGRQPSTGRHVRWAARCSCGSTKTVTGDHLRNGSARSCGCLQRELTSERSTTHGATKGGVETPEHQVWKAMLRRCRNPNAKGFQRYGGRGIAVCERWLTFENFLADMGPRPSAQHSIERKNNDGHYEPGNCVWATRTEQARNKRTNALITWNGITATVQEWSERTGIGRSTIQYRMGQLGWSAERALTTPGGVKSKLGPEQYAEIRGLAASGVAYREIAERFGVTSARVSQIVTAPSRQSDLAQRGIALPPSDKENAA